ncbi:MAG: hypothetical protein M1831_002526 [Alyxoria varia]|nr:MAG: hypothetical protein M1831_002526 [Alyxoria varia]
MFQRFSWLSPVFSAIVWLGTLLGLLLYWVVAIDTRGLPTLSQGQTIPFISDIGALRLKPLFIAGSATMVVFLNAGLIFERWMRHTGRLAPNTSWVQKILSIIAIIGAMIGGIGLILLSIFDTFRHPVAHDRLLAVFIVGYLISAIFICAEFQRLGRHYRQHRVLRASFWLKLAFIIVEFALAIPFGLATSKRLNQDTGAILEWVIAFVFTGYIISFVVDLVPALHKYHDYTDTHPRKGSARAIPNGHGGFEVAGVQEAGRVQHF